jgi:hypothetical protein
MSLGQGLALFALTLAFCTADCAAQTEQGPVRNGDRWAYDIKDDLTGDLRQSVTVIVVDVSEKEITARAMVRGKDRPQTMVFDLDWGRIDDGAWKLQPAGIGIRKPLQVGGEWRSDANAMNMQSGVAFRASGLAKVAAEEKVTTPAGTFDTYRIDRTTDQHTRSNQVFHVDVHLLVRPSGSGQSVSSRCGGPWALRAPGHMRTMSWKRESVVSCQYLQQ